MDYPSYIASMAREMSLIALKDGLPFLAFLLAMAQAEAEAVGSPKDMAVPHVIAN